jgi:hypothetical protein
MASRFVVADNNVIEELKTSIVKTRILEKVQFYGLEYLRNGQHQGTSAKIWRQTRFHPRSQGFSAA